MSHKASNWLAELPAGAINNGAFRVLFHLCDAHNSKRPAATACFPSQETLRDVTGLSNGGLNNALNAIEKAGLMRRRRTRNTDGTKGPTYYILGCDGPIEQEPTPESGDGANSKNEVEPSPNSGSNHLQQSGDKPVNDPVKEPCAAVAPHEDIDFDLIFSACPRKGSWEATEAAVLAEVEAGAKPADLLAAAKAYAAEQAGNEPRFIKLSENFFAEKVWERFVGQSSSQAIGDEHFKRWVKEVQNPTRFGRLRPDTIRTLINAGAVTSAQIEAAEGVWA